jgi:hypothetical protein
MAREVEVKENVEYWKEKAKESMATTGWGDDDSTSCGSMPDLVRPRVEDSSDEEDEDDLPEWIKMGRRKRKEEDDINLRTIVDEINMKAKTVENDVNTLEEKDE